jgi:hypothetical protein
MDMMAKLMITGTFLDEISHDIPSANWGRDEWRKDFDAMKSIGIDTVIIIRAGYKDKAIFDSDSLKVSRAMRPVYDDLLDLFLEEAERCHMDLYFGLYDSGIYWLSEDFTREIEINQRFTEEVIRKYGHRKALTGWYASHELHAYDDAQMKLYLALSKHLRDLKDMPILMSPYIKGRKQFDQVISPEEHERQWDMVLSTLAGSIDIIAFQDGQVDFLELSTYMTINHKLAKKYGIASWSNVETFERGMPINFLPIAWPNLCYKIEVAHNVGVEKLITFEFSHFLSPNSIYSSAHNLFKRYSAWLSATY